jgi:hypothetical protein
MKYPAPAFFQFHQDVSDAVQNMAASTAIAGLSLPHMLTGETSWALRFSSAHSKNESATAIGGAIGHGLTDHLSINAKAGYSKAVTTLFIGLQGKF